MLNIYSFVIHLRFQFVPLVPEPVLILLVILIVVLLSHHPIRGKDYDLLPCNH